MAQKHSEAFWRDAVQIALTGGLSRKQVATDLGVGISTLGMRTWKMDQPYPR
jgi:transposase